MRKLDVSAISPSNGFPVKSGTITHLQLAYQEAISETAKGIIGYGYDPTKGYILNGCLNSGSGSSYIIASGSIYFNGEVYLVDPATFTISGSNVAVGTITVSFNSSAVSDPVQFQDGVNRNVHQIRKIVFAPGLSGSGAVDYVNCKKINSAQVPIGGSVNYKPPTGDLSEFDGFGLGIGNNVIGWALCNGNNGTDDETGKFEVMFKTGDADFGTLGDTGGGKTHTLSIAELPTHHLTFNLFVNDSTGGVQGNTLYAENDNGAAARAINSADIGSGTAFEILNPFIVKLRIQRIY